jgi:hypothetical protein
MNSTISKIDKKKEFENSFSKADKLVNEILENTKKENIKPIKNTRKFEDLKIITDNNDIGNQANSVKYASDN